MVATVYIVDDDQAMRDALQQLLRNAKSPVQAFSSGEAFLESVEQDSEGCVILDMAMPGLNGYEVQAGLKEKHIDLPILFLTGHGDVKNAVKAVKAGAVDFLEKPITGEVLLERVRGALCLDAERQIERHKAREISDRYEWLSRREREVMGLVVGGLSNREVAEQLGISPRTVETHRTHVMFKMGAANLVDLVSLAKYGIG